MKTRIGRGSVRRINPGRRSAPRKLPKLPIHVMTLRN
jgi:hypothetical protein